MKEKFLNSSLYCHKGPEWLKNLDDQKVIVIDEEVCQKSKKIAKK